MYPFPLFSFMAYRIAPQNYTWMFFARQTALLPNAAQGGFLFALLTKPRRLRNAPECALSRGGDADESLKKIYCQPIGKIFTPQHFMPRQEGVPV
jgi:hypothetical protein